MCRQWARDRASRWAARAWATATILCLPLLFFGVLLSHVTFPGGEGKWGKSPDFMRANGVEVIDLHDSECIEMMSRFIREHPELWNEDIGVD